jgi:hypothetical protein
MAATTARVERDRLAEENKTLLRNLGHRYQTFEEWEAALPQQLRDEFAARALIASTGDTYRAAIRLGFGRVTHRFPEELLPKIFCTEGVRKILARDLREPEKYKAAMIQRMVQFALYGDEQNAVRAFQMLAKVCGWQKQPDVLVQHNRQTVLALVSQKDHRGQITSDTPAELPAFLEHEPGAATRIDSGDVVAVALDVEGEDE